MTTVDSRKLVFYNKVFKVITEFYSFIIIKKLRNIDQLTNFRSVENTLKSNIKILADINFLILKIVTNDRDT